MFGTYESITKVVDALDDGTMSVDWYVYQNIHPYFNNDLRRIVKPFFDV